VNSSAIDATEDAVSCRTVRSGGRGTVLQQPFDYADAPECTHAHAGSPLAVEATSLCAAVKTQLADMDLTAALETIWVFVRRLNRYVEEQAPWKLAKEEAAEGAAGQAAAGALDATLWDLAEGLRLLSVLLHAFIPSTAAAIRERLGLDGADPGWHEARWGLLPGGLSAITGAPLFPRIED
jgi:methionyl-tRNA synthetase